MAHPGSDGLTDPVPEAARIELTRLGLRWQQLPLDRARRAAPTVRAVAQAMLDEVAADTGSGGGAGESDLLPDLGPAVAIDQLTVAVYDASRAGTPWGADPAPHVGAAGLDVAGARVWGGGEAAGVASDLAGRLAELRRRLAALDD